MPAIPLAPGRYVIGSGPESTVRLEVPGVRPRHCLIVAGPSRAVVRAYDARTWLNDRPVTEASLAPGDRLVRDAHRTAVTTALEELERYTHARIGGNNPAEQTGKFIAAKFEHDTARPVNGYAAPQLHTHAVIFNVTERADGSTRALQPQALFESQNYATAVYQSALTLQLRKLGYEIEPDSVSLQVRRHELL